MEIERKKIQVSLLRQNTGQIVGLPKNPRTIKDERYKQLVKSIQDDPEFMQVREIVAVKFGTDYVVVGGHQRLKAVKELGWSEVPVKIFPEGTTADKLRAFTLKDNASFGETELNILQEEWANFDFKEMVFDVDFEEKKRKPWGAGRKGGDEKRSNLEPKSIMREIQGKHVFCSFRTSDEGLTLSEIKTREDCARHFADCAVSQIKKICCLNDVYDMALCYPSKRRHKERNFAEIVCEMLAEATGLRLYKDVFRAKNKQRVQPVFYLEKEIKERNIIIFDDIVTTGSTLTACGNLLEKKNVLFIAGINNNYQQQ